MACNCRKNSARFQVVSGERVVYVTSKRGTADAVSRRYPGSEVVERS